MAVRELDTLEKSRVVSEFRERTLLQGPLIRRTLELHLQSLETLGALLAPDPIDTRDNLRTHFRNERTAHPAFDKLFWAPIVASGEQSRVEQQLRLHGITDVRLRTGTTDDALTAHSVPLIYADPSESIYPIGTDLGAADIGPLLEAARSTQHTLVSELKTDARFGGAQNFVHVIAPAIQRDSHDDEPSPATTPMKVTGFVIGLLDVQKLITQAQLDPAIDLTILDISTGTDASKREIARSTPLAPEPNLDEAFTTQLPVHVGGRTWLLAFSPNPGWLAQQKTAYPQIVQFFGAAITLLLAAYVVSAVRGADLVSKRVKKRTAELESVQDALREDVRRREETEALLRISQHQLNALMENSPNAIFMKDAEGRYLTVNRRFAEMHGRSREEFVGRRDIDLFAPEVASRLRLSDTRVLSSGRAIELEESLVLSDGPHTSIIHKFPLLDEQGVIHGLCGISTDISERKRAEAEIRESRRQLESLLGQLPGMAFRFVNDGNFSPVYVSRGALGLTGHSSRDFVEGAVRFEEIVHPEDRERYRSAISSAVKRRRGFEVEFRIVDRGGKVKWVFERGQGIYDEDGKLLSIEGLAIDITQRKDAESEKLLVERRLLEGQKLESIGVLAGGIAHDFNNLLTGVIGNANLASLELPPNSRVQQNLKQIEIASQRAAELCQQMLAYAGKGRFMVHRVEIGSLVENTVPLLRASISKRALLKFELTPGLPSILADPTQMRQIVMNLVINASEAIGETDGEITITTKLVKPGPEYLAGAVLAPTELDRDHVLLQVQDTGSGMTPETMAKIFDPFFTTKFAGRGLGLAAVLGILRSHKGGVKVTSVPGKGSSFSLLFPVAAGTPEPAGIRRNTAPPWRQDGLALVVDDEDHVRSVAAGMLHSCGLRTETARDGYEALDLFRARPGEFDIILLDMTMPRLTGEETLVQMREIRPDIRVLFMSGYNRREVVDALDGNGTLSFIQKPFTLDSLREQLKVMLD